MESTGRCLISEAGLLSNYSGWVTGFGDQYLLCGGKRPVLTGWDGVGAGHANSKS